MRDFQQIGAVAAKLVADAEVRMAARGQNNGAHKFELGGDGPMSQGEGEPLSPSPIAQAGRAASNLNGKARGADGDPATRVKGGRQTSGGTVMQNGTTNEHRMVPALPYVSRSIATVSNTTPHRESFARSAVVIDLAMWKVAHDTGPKWGMR